MSKRNNLLKKFLNRYYIQVSSIYPFECPLVQIVELESNSTKLIQNGSIVNVRHYHLNSTIHKGKIRGYSHAVVDSDLLRDWESRKVAFRPATEKEIVKYLIDGL